MELTDDINNGNADAYISDVTTESFMGDVIEASKQQLVLLDLWAPWCGPCKQLTPLLENATRAANGAIRLAKMNIDEHPAVAQQLQVQSIPAVFAFKDGRPVDGFMGALPESQLKQFIEKNLGEELGASPSEEALAAAQNALHNHDISTAAQLFAQILQNEPENIEAIAGMAHCHIASENYDQARATLALCPPAHENNAAIASARAALELAEKSQELGDVSALQGRIAQNPDDHQARYDLALALNAAGQKNEAIEALLEIIARNKTWQDDAARKQLVEFFDAYGNEDAATIAGRRKLSSLLFS